MSAALEVVVAVPEAAPARAPKMGRLWLAVLRVAWVALAFFMWDELCLVLMDCWLLEELGYASVFWTNFSTGTMLFALGLASSVFVIGPAFAAKLDKIGRRILIHVGLMIGVISGYLLAQEYLTFLMAGGQDFGVIDPIFGNDISFYVFDLHPIWTAWGFLVVGTLMGLTSWAVCTWLSTAHLARRPGQSRSAYVIGRVSSLGFRVTLVILGVLAAFGSWFGRYDVLIDENVASSIYAGAAYVDVNGLFSTVNDYWFTAFMTLIATVVVILLLTRAARIVRATDDKIASWWPDSRRLVWALVIVLVLDLGFKGVVVIRQSVSVKPNEPVVQLPYIDAHIKATRAAFNLGSVEEIVFTPNGAGDPLPDIEALLASPTIQNAPLWPGFASYLEDLVDTQHAQRIIQTDGDALVYGPTLDIFRQEQKLRAYYNFLDVDTTRYQVDGKKKMLISAVREVPLVEPKPWLAWWGQQYMLYTHGLGIVTAGAADVSELGGPVYESSGIPVVSRTPQLQPANQRIYYGEGAGSMAYSNVDRVQEFDYPTDEGRATVEFPEDVRAGVRIDSLLKRLVLGYKSGQFFEILFSGLIDDDTRVHYFRTPVERLERIAPYLYYDTDPFAFSTKDGQVKWLVNGITWSDRYPYSQFQHLGDKSDRRTQAPRPHIWMNYAADAVKATIDAYTGEVRLYRFKDEPVINTIAEIYPGLLADAEQMPADERAQVTYPMQLMHLQFDDLYILYQQDDPMSYFNMEDMWDDGDEVLGPILDSGSAIRFSIEPFSLIVEADGTVFPKAADPAQFALAMMFTPEGARNLRAVPVVYQDGDDYGRLISLQVPKGRYVMGPEQADSAIDQEPSIAQQFSWWNRRGLEVIRGHTTGLIVKNELIYVEPIFLRSQQNALTQMKQVAVVFRGKARMAPTLEGALRAAIAAHSEP